MVWKTKLSRRSNDKRWNRPSGSRDGRLRKQQQNVIQIKSCLKKGDAQSCSSSFESSKRRSIAECLSSHSASYPSQSSSNTSSSYISSLSRSSSSASSSKTAKSVTFDRIEIREYERTVGDNPSVSVGPPVSINWKYRDSVKTKVEDYEAKRGARREQLELILTRHERESLLVEWGVPTHKIAGGTRSALKAKNQRKQTIINAGKMARIEEAMEAASKRLKGAFSLKPIETIPEEKAVTVQTANVTVSTEKPPLDGHGVLSQAGPSSNQVVSVEPETEVNFDKLGMNVTISRLVSDAPEGALMASCSSFEQYLEGDDAISMGDAYTLGATTLGNKSGSPSMIEMENFYQELELEMFGEEASLPCMVGQTLEVSYDENDYSESGDRDDITRASAFRSMSRIEVSEPSSQYSEDQKCPQGFTPHQEKPTSEDPSISYRLDREQDDYHSRPRQEKMYSHHSNDVTSPHTVSSAILWHYGQRHQESEFQGQLSSQRNRCSSYESLLDDKLRQHREGSRPPYETTQPQFHIYSTPQQNQMISWNDACPQHWNTNTNSNDNNMPVPSRHGVYRSNGQSYFDGPRITHSPLHGHLSPNQWMGECDGASRSYVNAAVTIVEDCNREV